MAGPHLVLRSHEKDSDSNNVVKGLELVRDPHVLERVMFDCSCLPLQFVLVSGKSTTLKIKLGCKNQMMLMLNMTLICES